MSVGEKNDILIYHENNSLDPRNLVDVNYKTYSNMLLRKFSSLTWFSG